MAANQILTLGVLAVLAAGAIVYVREKTLKGAAVAAAVGFLAVGIPAPLHHRSRPSRSPRQQTLT